MSRGPSLNLTWDELACKDAAKTPYPDPWHLSRAIPLAHEFERIRAAAGGQPIPIISAYRTAAYNARIVGAAKASQHVQGRALDLAPPKGMTVAQFLAVVVSVARRPDAKIKGVGEYHWGIHVDIRPGERLARWSGSKPVQVADNGT